MNLTNNLHTEASSLLMWCTLSWRISGIHKNGLMWPSLTGSTSTWSKSETSLLMAANVCLSELPACIISALSHVKPVIICCLKANAFWWQGQHAEHVFLGEIVSDWCVGVCQRVCRQVGPLAVHCCLLCLELIPLIVSQISWEWVNIGVTKLLLVQT